MASTCLMMPRHFYSRAANGEDLQRDLWMLTYGQNYYMSFAPKINARKNQIPAGEWSVLCSGDYHFDCAIAR